MSSVSKVRSRVNAYASRRRQGIYFGHSDSPMPGRKGSVARTTLANMIKAKRKGNKRYQGGKML